MPLHIALLRAINVGGAKPVGMASLRELFAGLGFSDIRTVLQSGNVVFRAEGISPLDLQSLLEREAEAQLRIRTRFFVRTYEQWKDIIARNPFPDEAREDPSHLLVVCLGAEATSDGVGRLQESIKGRECVRAFGREAYITYPDGIGRSRVTMAAIEKAFGTEGTGRNWNTVVKLGSL